MCLIFVFSVSDENFSHDEYFLIYGTTLLTIALLTTTLLTTALITTTLSTTTLYMQNVHGDNLVFY